MAQTGNRVVDDPMCDESRPRIITYEDISSAAGRISTGIIKTTSVKSRLSKEMGIDILLKNESQQFTGSFTERGALNALIQLSDEQKKKGVIAASLGNYSQGLSYQGNLLGIPVTVVMPVAAPLTKVQNCKDFNATVVVAGIDMTESKAIAIQMAREKGLTYINGYDHPHVMAGQGTIGIEIMEEVPDVYAVIVPVGGGGLIAGVATAIKKLNPKVLIYGVETEKCPSMSQALKASGPVTARLLTTLADGLAVPRVGGNAYATVSHQIDKMVVVKEEWVAQAILTLVEIEKCIVEGAGASGIAAIMQGLVPELKGKKVVCLLTGGNIESTLLVRCLERGLAAENRLVKFKVTISDRPGGISELCKLLSSIGVSIKDIMHERAWVKFDAFSAEVQVICETRGLPHVHEMKTLLCERYNDVVFTPKIE